MRVGLTGKGRGYAAILKKLRCETRRRKASERTLSERKRHYTKLLQHSLQMQEDLRCFSRQILLAQEEERKQISRELHDEVGQLLIGINVRLAVIKNEILAHPKRNMGRIAGTQRLVGKSMEIIRRFARELRPSVLDDLGLVPALQSHINDFEKRTRIPVRFRVSAFDKTQELRGMQRTAFYRVAEEALSNVFQHAGASLVKMDLQNCNGVIRMKINDNGKSFSIGSMLRTKIRKRFGLLGMRERMEMIGGEFIIDSSAGKGTTICAEAPLRISNGRGNSKTQRGFR